MKDKLVTMVARTVYYGPQCGCRLNNTFLKSMLGKITVQITPFVSACSSVYVMGLDSGPCNGTVDPLLCEILNT